MTCIDKTCIFFNTGLFFYAFTAVTVSSGSRFLERYIRRDVQIKLSDFLFNITLTALSSDFVVLCLSEFKTILQVRFACEEKHYLVFFSPIYVYLFS